MILSDPARSMAGVHHPWRRLREMLPDWEVAFRDLPGNTLGATDQARQVILLEARQHQAQRRASLDHELIHAEAGDVGCQHPARERQVAEQSARRLIPLDRLVDAAVWAHDIEELAEELWVDLPTVQCRLDTLTDAERVAVRTALAIRDFHEEGME